jgi:hypothetical protein
MLLLAQAMTNADKRVQDFGQADAKAKKNKAKRLDERDGLFESNQLVNQRLVTSDGRQLLREQTHEEE